VWRIVVRDGPAAASVRGVAREAGLSMGSVRHFFATQHELLTFAVEEVIAGSPRASRQGAPARELLVEQGRALDAALAVLEEVLPLERRAADRSHRVGRVHRAAALGPGHGRPAPGGRRRSPAAVPGLRASPVVLGHVHLERDQAVESAASMHCSMDSRCTACSTPDGTP
jgi:AcrR family transcriptional regulator